MSESLEFHSVLLRMNLYTYEWGCCRTICVYHICLCMWRCACASTHACAWVVHVSLHTWGCLWSQHGCDQKSTRRPGKSMRCPKEAQIPGLKQKSLKRKMFVSNRDALCEKSLQCQLADFNVQMSEVTHQPLITVGVTGPYPVCPHRTWIGQNPVNSLWINEQHAGDLMPLTSPSLVDVSPEDERLRALVPCP